MKNWFFALIMLVSSSAFAGENLTNFLKACGWGTVIGAAAGTVTLAFNDSPSEHTSNIARGASLGLYGGIAYGILALDKQSSASKYDDYTGSGWVAPQFHDGKVEGANAHVVLANF